MNQSSSNQQFDEIPFEAEISLIEFPKHELMPHTDLHIIPQALMGKTLENQPVNNLLSRSQHGEAFQRTISNEHNIPNESDGS